MKNLSFKDKEIFVGIDVHKRSWDIQIMTQHSSQQLLHKSVPSPEFVSNYLHKHYPKAKFSCVYEAGFSGFWIQEELSKSGIPTLVVHPGDVPTTDKEKRFKDDRVDCKKLANSLRSGQLEGIYIPPKQLQQDRSLVRQRYQFARDERMMKHRIRSHLDFYGIQLEDQNTRIYWSSHYIRRLEEYARDQEDQVLQGYLEKLRSERSYTLGSIRRLRALSQTSRYKASVDLLRSIPGVGLLTSMVYLTEIGDLSRFKKDDHYIAYIGLVPGMRSSGEKEHRGRLSRRGNKRVRTALVLSAWMAVRNNPEMVWYYETYKSNGKPANKAIIKIARKLALIMKAVLRDKMKYISSIK